MRISDWSSDVCSSDLAELWCSDHRIEARRKAGPFDLWPTGLGFEYFFGFIDRKSVVQGKSVSVRVDLGGRRIIKKKNTQSHKTHNKTKITHNTIKTVTTIIPP